MLRHALPFLFFALAQSAGAQGLRLKPDAEFPFRARLHLLSIEEAGASRLLGAQLMGDYYLSAAGTGLRLSGGWVLGPQSLLGSGLVPTRPGVLGIGHRRLLGTSVESTLGQPYLGVGFSHHGDTWGVTADLGVAINGNTGVRLGRMNVLTAQSMDDTLRRLQWSPTLQLGLSYRF